VTTQPVHDRLDRTPTWMVQGVFDPEVKGQNFSYTIGLHDSGLPELHLWASPTDGDDPGDDWAFSHNDRCHILNELAFMMIDGRLGPGSSVVKKYDQGHATVTFGVQPPGDRDALEALGIAPDAHVLPVAWSLERTPIGPLAPLSPQALQVAFDEYADLCASLPRGRLDAPDGWDLPPIPSFEPEARFGPRTPVVLARAAQLWSTRNLEQWIETILWFASLRSLMWPATVACALARPAGRTLALEELEREAKLLVEHVVVGRSKEWRRAVGVIADRHGFASGEDQHLAHTAHHALAEATLAVLSLEAVADLADPNLRLSARGPWIAAFDPGRAIPGPAWSAAPAVVRAVRKLLRPLALHEWSAIVSAHHGPDEPYRTLCADLELRYFTTASGIPWSKLSDLPAGREFRHLQHKSKQWPGMVEWASCLATLLTYRAQYSAEQVDTFVSPVRELLPDLERVVNAVR
jgi:hypothetical protein